MENKQEFNSAIKVDDAEKVKDCPRKSGSTRGHKYERKSVKAIKKSSDMPKRNDWSFYAASEQIVKDVASIPFNYLGGTNFPAQVYQFNPTANKEVKYPEIPLPSVLTLNYVNSIGITSKRTEGVNMAAVQLYTFVRHANSGARNYEAADLMMYVLAMRDIWSEYCELRRAIGLAPLYNYYNHNFPDTLLSACHINADDLRQNIAQYRGRLNLLCKKINSFAVPKYFKIFDRTAYVASYIFSDSESARGQFYVFTKEGYYMWSGTTSETGTELVYTAHSKSNQTLSERLDILEAMLDSLFLDEDALTMSGDILKAFSQDSLLTLTEIPDTYVTAYLYDENTLSQIENSVSCGFRLAGTGSKELSESLNIKQNNQIITFQPVIQQGADQAEPIQALVKRFALNSHKDNPTAMDIIEWTRLMCSGKWTYPGSTPIFTLTSSGLEIVESFTMYTAGQTPSTFWTINTASDLGIVGSTGKLNSLAAILRLSQFDWHPILYIVSSDKQINTSDLEPAAIFGDLKVATTITSEDLDNINQAAVYGALYAQNLYK